VLPAGIVDPAACLVADRMHVDGNLELDDGLHTTGTLRLPNAVIGGYLRLSGAQLSSEHGIALLADGMEVGGDIEGRDTGDLVCVEGFTAAGGVRARVADVHKSVQFVGATLATSGRTRYALNLYDLTTIDLLVLPAAPPAGAVRLAAARVGTFTDAEELWAAEGGVTVDGFDYQTIGETRITDTRTRLHLLEQATGDYAPGRYEQLAAAYRRAGHEDLAERVLMTRQIRRYREAGLAGRAWGALQRWTVGFGYQPWLAVCWLVLAWLLGAIWFVGHVPTPVDDGQHPVFDAWIFAADTLLPIVNLGQDGYWRLEGASQWIATGLDVVGWILATTAAAGAARILKRV
jgi:hypothetical protein